jgi:hypothetical protein
MRKVGVEPATTLKAAGVPTEPSTSCSSVVQWNMNKGKGTKYSFHHKTITASIQEHE